MAANGETMADNSREEPVLEGLGYSPDAEDARLRKGYSDELEMARQIVRVRPREIILSYGNPPGIQGPDIVSIGEDGLLARWDVKWRTVDRTAGPSVAAEAPLEQAAVELAVWRAIDTRRVSLKVGLTALRLYEAGTYNIFTVDPTIPDDAFLVQAEHGHFKRS